MDSYQHAARGLLADEVSSAAAIGLVNVSVEESFQVNEDAFHDRIIKVSESAPACPHHHRLGSYLRRWNSIISRGSFPTLDSTRYHPPITPTDRIKPLNQNLTTQHNRRSPRMNPTSSSPPSP